MPDIIDNVKVGEHIKMLLKKHQMTQDDLADKLSISKSAVSQNLRGKSAFDIHNLIQIAKLFNISLEVLLKLKSEEEDDIISEYQRVTKRGLKALIDVPAADLKIYEPDLYGKVLVEYIIDQRATEMFQYLIENDVKLVEPYYHRAKDIYVKVILFCLEENYIECDKFIILYTKIQGSFQIEDEQTETLLWTLLNKLENQKIVKSMLSIKDNTKTKLMNFIKQTDNLTPLTRKDYIHLIAKHRLNHVLDTYLKHQPLGDDLYEFTKTMVNYQYEEAIIQYVEKYYQGSTHWMSRLGSDRQKTIMLIMNTKSFDLIKVFAKHHLYSDMTQVVQKAIEYELSHVVSYLIGNYKSEIQFKKIAKTCIELKQLSLLEDIIHLLNQDDLNDLLAWTNHDEDEVILFLILRGAQFDEKHYNMKTFEKVNQFIHYLIKHRGK
jgi:transcriptional regulator with XRE-family HTH domain